MSDGDTENELMAAATTLRRGMIRLARRLQLERPERTVSLNQFSLLGHLSRRGPLAVGDLAALERAQPQSLTRPLAGLADARQIERTTDPDDGRKVIVSITDAGRAVLSLELRQQAAWLAAAMTRLTPTERGVLVLAAEVMERMSQDSDTVALRAPRALVRSAS